MSYHQQNYILIWPFKPVPRHGGAPFEPRWEDKTAAATSHYYTCHTTINISNISNTIIVIIIITSILEKPIIFFTMSPFTAKDPEPLGFQEQLADWLSAKAKAQHRQT